MQINNTCIEMHVINTCVQLQIFKFFSKTCKIMHDSDVCRYLHALIFHVHARTMTRVKMPKYQLRLPARSSDHLQTMHVNAKRSYLRKSIVKRFCVDMQNLTILQYTCQFTQEFCFFHRRVIIYFSSKQNYSSIHHTILAQKTCSFFKILRSCQHSRTRMSESYRMIIIFASFDCIYNVSKWPNGEEVRLIKQSMYVRILSLDKTSCVFMHDCGTCFIFWSF